MDIEKISSGTVTFLFTDIEGSTRLWQETSQTMAFSHARHDAILREAIESYHGYIFQIVGDSFSAAFHNAFDGLRAALFAQRVLQMESWDEKPTIKVRMGLHTGNAEVHPDSSSKHILAVAITIGGLFSRLLVRSIAQKSDDLNTVSSLTHVAVRMDRAMVNLGIILAVMQKWPIFRFLQGAPQNWLLVSDLLLLIMIALIPAVFIAHNKKVESLLQDAHQNGKVTSELSAALREQKNKLAYYAEELIVLAVAALILLKPF